MAVTIGGIMTMGIVAIDQDTSILQAAREMRDRRMGSLVVERNGEYLGILTENDFVRKVAAEELDLRTTKVSQVMNFPIVSLDAYKSIDDAVSIMVAKKIRHLGVTEGGKLLAVISARDILMYSRLFAGSHETGFAWDAIEVLLQ